MKNRENPTAPEIGAESTRRPPPLRRRVPPELYYRCRGAYYLRNAIGKLVRVNQQMVMIRLKRLGFSLIERDQIIDELIFNPVENPPQ
jgi:hypothetical protein